MQRAGVDGESSGDALFPTLPFFFQIVLWIRPTAQYRSMIRLRLFQDENLSAMGPDQKLVAGLELQSFAGLARDHDLVLGG